MNPFKIFEGIDFKKFSYFPQIRYRNLILTPCLWNVDKFNLEIEEKKVDINKFKAIILKWKEKMNLPEIIYLAEGDNRLAIAFKNKECIEILYHYIVIKGKRVKLTEIDFDFYENIVKNKQSESYYSEYIIPLRNKLSNNKVKINNNIIIRKKSEMRYVNPYKEWGYYKFYHYDGYADEVLLNYLNPFFKRLMQEKLISKYFYIRYADPKRHIRVRFKIESSVDKLKILELIDGLIVDLDKTNLIYNTCIDTYERELERYGGEKCIEEAENLFCSDSICSLELLKLLNNKKNKIKKDYIAIIAIIKYLDDFGYTFEKQLEIFDKIVGKNDYRKEFQKERNILIKIANNNDGWKGLKMIEGGSEILAILELRSKLIDKYNKKIDEAFKENLLFSSKEEIIYSLIHMFCNRFLSGKREEERKVNAFVRHTLYSLKYVKMVKKNEE
ncbi:MAG: thiopeptide-type bacteriocin biosynthesis protein [Sarcina sp.]